MLKNKYRRQWEKETLLIEPKDIKKATKAQKAYILACNNLWNSLTPNLVGSAIEELVQEIGELKKQLETPRGSIKE